MALDQAFMRFYNEELPGLNKNNFLRYCLRINLSIAAATTIVILSAYGFFSMQIAQEKSFWLPVCLVVVIVCSTFLRMSSISSRMEKKVGQYALQVVLISVVEKVLFTLIAFYRADYRLAIITIATGYAVLAIIFFLIKRRFSLMPVGFVPRETTVTILKFALPYLPVLLLSWLNNSIPLIVLRKYVSYAAVGIYTNAVTIANILTIVQTGFSAYWGPFIYENYHKEENKIQFQKIERLIVVLLISISVLIVLFQDIIYLLVGEEFRASKAFFPFLMLTPICNTIADMTGIGIMLSKKSYLNIFTFIGNTTVNLLCSYLLIPRIGVMGAGIAVAASSLTMLIIRSFLGGKYYKISDKQSFLVFSILIIIAVCVVNAIFTEQIFLKSTILVVILCVFAVWFYRDINKICKTIYKRLKNHLSK